ncbi:MAG: hypothetical protein WKF53_12295, partial [Rubrobacter sp.]
HWKRKCRCRTNALFDILQETEGDLAADRIREAARSYTVEQGTTATGYGVKFDENNQNVRCAPFVTQWRDGELVTVFPEEAAVAEPMLPPAGG